jgi:hypothetical protein
VPPVGGRRKVRDPLADGAKSIANAEILRGRRLYSGAIQLLWCA